VDTDAASPGCEMPVVRSGVEPGIHVQQGSPSSTPFDTPSPSESAWHSEVVHERCAVANAIPAKNNVLRTSCGRLPR
jgi:hypothetical protein